MTDIKALVARLDAPGRAAMARAAERAHGRGQATVELEHLLLELLADDAGETATFLRASAVDPLQVRRELGRAIDGFVTGPARTPALAVHLVDTVKEAWTFASLEQGGAAVGPITLLRAMLTAQTPRRLLLATAPILARITRACFDEALGGAADGVPASTADDPLAAYTLDLTAEAEAGRIDPVTGRDAEIRQLVDVLLRRRQNNPILTGEAGVGKTAVVEGLACRLAQGLVPLALAGTRLLALDLGALQAGAGMRGEFEERLRGVVDAVAASPRPVVLFIDEAHLLIGAGGQPGQGDAANLLKPALARGAFRCIAATTWGEYKRHIEKDLALARRFELIKIAEPAPEAAIEMLRGAAARLEAHHEVRILEEGLSEAVRLSDRYIAGRQLPDKAIGVLDTACARVAVSQSEPPPALAAARARLVAIELELARLHTQRGLGRPDDGERCQALDDAAGNLREEVARLESRWAGEREAVAALLAAFADPTKDEAEIRYRRLTLETLQEGGEPLVHAVVDARAIAQVVSGSTGVPTGELLRDGAAGAALLLDRLTHRVVAQDGALSIICRRIQTYFAQLGEPGKPTGVFLLAGPSGVGKTETAIALAETLYGGRAALVTVNMSEYQEAHSISGLKGAPPGYVGYGRGGVMTEAVRRRPYSVLLLDEIEKAHKDVIELFYQVFDKGVLEDSEGQQVDFRNTLIILTANIGAETIATAAARGIDDPQALAAAIRPELLAHFPAALLGRLTVVPYRPLGPAQLAAIARMKLDQLCQRVATGHGAALTWDRQVVEALVARATETESGARNLDAIIADSLSPQVAGRLLDQLAAAEPLHSLHVTLAGDGGFALEAR